MSDTQRFDRSLTGQTTEVGADDDQPGIAQPVTQDEIDDILNNPAMTIEEKQARLASLAGQFDDRSDIDRGSEFEPLEMQVRDAIAMLAEGGHAYGTLESVGMDPDSRSDARAPDDFDNEVR